MTHPGDERADALRRAADRLLRRQGGPRTARTGDQPWQACYFGLPAVAEYQRAPLALQSRLLADCSAGLLNEAWSIERCGVDFCARMASLCETDEERRLFALIGAEEVKHSAWLEPWVDLREADRFSAFIRGVAQAGGAQSLAYLLQVVLEGFGIVHYRGLAGACVDEGLAALLRRMAQDEALHYGAGLAAFQANRLGDAERSFLSESACAFLQAMRTGPQAVVAALDRQLGIPRSRLAGVFAELDAQAATSTKLQHLRRLMSQPGMEWLIAELDEKGAFIPCSDAQCASVYAAAL